jgi:hypothetical protein
MELTKEQRAEIDQIRHEESVRRRRSGALPDASLAFDAVRNVRNQISHQVADLHCTSVDSSPHRKRERIFRTLFNPG